MRQSLLILALLLGLNTTANAANKNNALSSNMSLHLEQFELEDQIFNNVEGTTQSNMDVISIESIAVITVEDETPIEFDTTQYLPEGFNALEGKNDINWDEIELIELEEEVELGFDTKDYLPKNFNPFKGMASSTNIVAVSIH